MKMREKAMIVVEEEEDEKKGREEDSKERRMIYFHYSLVSISHRVCYMWISVLSRDASSPCLVAQREGFLLEEKCGEKRREKETEEEG